MSPLPTPVAAVPVGAHATSPGGFAWWYVDLVDEHGDGIVVIAAAGLPFLPGYAAAARSGDAPRPIDRPSLCVATVSSGFWALHELPPSEVTWEPGRVRLGSSELTIEIGERRVRVAGRLAGTLPGCPWSLRLDVDGPRRAPLPGEPDVADHEWSLLTACATGAAELTVGGEVTRIRGRAYVDRNAGTKPLEQLDVAWWHWGRLALRDRELVWYAASDRSGSSRSFALAVDPGGGVELLPGAVATRGWRWGRWLLGRPATVELPGGIEVALTRPVDDSPFYARFRVESAGGHGFAEVCDVRRVDRGWFRPLVGMTIAPPTGPASLWLPLFAGPRRGRLERLTRSLWGAP